MRRFETRRADWISFAEAKSRVLEGTPPLGTESVPSSKAYLRAVAREVRSSLTLPPGPTSHMDGYVVRADELDSLEAAGRPVAFFVVGTSLPGSPWTDPLAPGTAVRVMTGALVPEEVDRVFPVEETDAEAAEPGVVTIGVGSGERSTFGKPGRYVRPAGEEAREGELLVAPGDTVETGQLALLAATGVETVEVYRAPRVACLITGSELVPAGDVSALQGGIRRADVLGPTLPHLIRAAGGIAIPPRRVPDEEGALEAAIRGVANEADLVVTTGGASMGSADLVKDVLDGIGFELDFWRIRMRPGSPVAFGQLELGGGDSVPLLSLPGNPVSAIVAFLTLGFPAVRSRGGHHRTSLPSVSATLMEEISGPEDLTRFFRMALAAERGGTWRARSSAAQGSGVLRSLALADGLGVVADGSPCPGVGDPIEVMLLPRSGWEET